ncbi:MAG: DUF721 domain-containing protein [Phyllobacteriaceae bacterium]|nr:DUF721 domain-containing protein [Phyllobacteriaceae bacterium]
MAAEKRGGNPRPLGDLVGGVVDPLLRKRAGISLMLLQSWEEIAGPRLAAVTRPEKIAWPRRLSEDEPFRAGQLVVACEAVAAMRLQHEAGEVIGRVNALLGFEAVERVRILQKPVNSTPPRRPAPRRLSADEEASLHRRTEGVDDAGLREALEALGRSVLAEKKVR